MDLDRLIWTKNIKPQYGEDWAWPAIHIPTIEPDLKIFALTWRNSEHRDKKNANEPQEGEQMILRQRGKVTHIVQMLNNKLYPDKKAGDEFNIYRLVQVVWMAKDWHNPPDTDKVFGCKINFPPNGKAIKLENLEGFQNSWNKGGLEFQQHVESVLKNH